MTEPIHYGSQTVGMHYWERSGWGRIERYRGDAGGASILPLDTDRIQPLVAPSVTFPVTAG